MWSQIILDGKNGNREQPQNRFKHSSCLSNEEIFIYGGKKLTSDGLSISATYSNLKDLWILELRTGRWTECKPKSLTNCNNSAKSYGGSSISRLLPSRLRTRRDSSEFWPPPLVESTLCAYKNNLYLFGGEIGLPYASYDDVKTRTPLWIYDLKEKRWRKWENQSSSQAPSPRRGHSVTVYSEYMLIYGGYQDLKGSLGDLWAFHFETESWHLFSSPDNKIPQSRISYSFNKYFHRRPSSWRYNSSGVDEVTNNLTIVQPPPRHSHASQFHLSSLYIYGGQSDLSDLEDMWRFDFDTKKWSQIKKKSSSSWPGTLKGHSLLKALNSIFIFGGIRDFHNKKYNEEIWRFDFINECWQKITIHGQKPNPRTCPTFIMLPALIRILPIQPKEEEDEMEQQPRRNSIEDGYWWDCTVEDETLSSYNLSGKANSRRDSGNEYKSLDTHDVESCLDNFGSIHPPTSISSRNLNSASTSGNITSYIDSPESPGEDQYNNNPPYADGEDEEEDEEESLSPISPLGPSAPPLVLKSMIRYSESANDFKSGNGRSNNGIRKSNSVRFNENTTTNGKILPKLHTSTSDYVSMETLSHQNHHQQIQSSRTSFFDNPNYQESNSNSSPGSEAFEMQRFSRDSGEPDAIMEDSNNYEIVTPNYLLLIGGQDHGRRDSKGLSNHLSLWRLRVSTDLIGQT